MAIKLFVFVGDSNAVGYGMSQSTLPAHLASPIAGAYIFNAGASYWGVLTPGSNTGTANYPQAWGPESQFAYDYMQAHPGDVALIVKAAKGSITIAEDPFAEDWSPDSVGEWFDIADATIDAARAAFLSAQGFPAPEVAATFLIDGPNAAYDAAKASAYGDDLEALFAAIRSEWMDNPDGEIIYSRMTDGAVMPYNFDVRVAQWSVDQADPNATSFKTIGFAMQPDQVHYAADGYVALGAAFYDEWIA